MAVSRVQGFITTPPGPPEPPRPTFLRNLMDVWQPIITIGAAIILITRLQSSIEHEGELRRILEQRFVEMLGQISTRQGENALRFDQRFAENAARDREVFIELKTGLTTQGDKIDRLASKLDTLAAGFSGLQQQQQQQRITR